MPTCGISFDVRQLSVLSFVPTKCQMPTYGVSFDVRQLGVLSFVPTKCQMRTLASEDSLGVVKVEQLQQVACCKFRNRMVPKSVAKNVPRRRV